MMTTGAAILEKPTDGVHVATRGAPGRRRRSDGNSRSINGTRYAPTPNALQKQHIQLIHVPVGVGVSLEEGGPDICPPPLKPLLGAGTKADSAGNKTSSSSARDLTGGRRPIWAKRSGGEEG